jgi:endo-1,3(4)-beta-glucanase
MKKNLIFLLLTITSALCDPCTEILSTDPLSTSPPPFVAQEHLMKPTPIWGSLQRPYATNSFFTNTILGNDFPIAPHPFQTKLSTQGLEICYPGRIATKTFVISPFVPNLKLTSVEPIASYKVTHFDSMSFTVEWKEENGEGVVASPIAKGSPFVTMKYQSLTPLISTIHAIITVNGDGAPRSITGTKFSLQMNNGQNWIIYAGSEITLNFGEGKLQGAAKFSGVLRATVALDSADEPILDAHAATYPIGVDVSYTFCGDEKANVKFHWNTEGGAPGDLLMLALPHHMDILMNPSTVIPKRYSSIKGKMTGVIGNEWLLEETLTSIKWFPPKPIDEDKRNEIAAALQEEKTYRPRAVDPYFFGKETAAMGKLALVADSLGDTATAADIRNSMKEVIDPWLLGTNSDPLKYDSTWGGICSTGGLSDQNADYGQGWYNDHHFHYGHLVYACATLGKEDPEWLNSRREAILALVRDFANPSSTDPFFVVSRHKDWYDGHSWASGLFGFGDSNNQESSSESVNAYYGVYLLGESLNHPQLKRWGKLLLASEIRSVQKYYQIPQSSEIYDPAFAVNKVVGVLWATKVDYMTYFGDNPEYIFGIQMIPFTPITEELVPKSWAMEQFPMVEGAITRTDPPTQEGWNGLVILNQAIVNKEAAWTNVHNLAFFDNGNTKTNSLHWIATRP